MVLSRTGAFFSRLKVIAEQLSPEAIWAINLSEEQEESRKRFV